MKKFILMLLVFTFFVVPMAHAKQIMVGVKNTPPFITLGANDEVDGFSIDLLKAIVKQIDESIEFKYVIDNDITSHLDSVINKRVDLGIAATTITADREAIMDFSQPFYQADLAILVPKQKTNVLAFVDILFSRELLMTLCGIAVYITIIAHLIWLSERGEHGHFPKKYLNGVGQGLWWTVVTISTVGYGDVHLIKPLSRALGVFVIFSGIMLFGICIATFTSVLTVNQLKPTINGPDDLPGRRVAVLERTFTAKQTEKLGCLNRPVRSLHEGLIEMDSGRVDAVIHDRPLLTYLIKDIPDHRYYIIPKGFASSTYGITFPTGSPLVESFDVALLKVMEGGRDSLYTQIHKKWFGE